MNLLGISISRNAMVLAVYAVITTAAVSAIYLGTSDRIASSQRAAQAKALLEIVPVSRHDNDMLDDTLPVGDATLLGYPEQRSAFVARQGSEAVAVVLPVVAPDGYSGRIEMIVGVNTDGSLAGVRVLTHSETPGLGDKIELKKSPWVLAFDGKSLDNPTEALWGVKKDGGHFDQFTGATITPRAITHAVHRALKYAQAHRDTLFAPAHSAPQAEVASHE